MAHVQIVIVTEREYAMPFVSLCRQYKLKSCGWISVKFSGPIDFGLLGWFFAFIPNYRAIIRLYNSESGRFLVVNQIDLSAMGGATGVQKCSPPRTQLLR